MARKVGKRHIPLASVVALVTALAGIYGKLSVDEAKLNRVRIEEMGKRVALLEARDAQEYMMLVTEHLRDRN